MSGYSEMDEADLLNKISKMEEYRNSDTLRQDIEHRPVISDVWVAASALQKAIRRGRCLSAQKAAGFLLQHDKKRLWRRLVVIALEDIGLADLELVSQVVWVSGKRAWRERNGGERKVVFCLVEALCGAPKNRDACDLVGIANADPALSEAREAMAYLPTNDLKTQALCQNGSLEYRTIAAWYLAGTITYPADNLQSRVGRFIHLVECLQELGVSHDTVEVLRTASGKSREPIAIGLAVLCGAHQKKSHQGDVHTEDVRSLGEIGGWPSEAFDIHTRPGGRAIRKFAATCAPVRQLVNDVTDPRQRAQAVASAVFRVEGSRVDRRCVFRQFADIQRRADLTSLQQFGLSRAIAKELLYEVESHLPGLHSIRVQGTEANLR